MKSKFLRVTLTYGVIFGGLMILEFLILNALDVDGVRNATLGIIINFLNYMVLPLMFAFLAANTYKNKFNQGYISFSEILRIGTATTVVAALLFSTFNLAYNYIFPEFIDQTIIKMRDIAMYQRDMALSQGATEQEVNSLEDIEKYLEGVRKSMQSFFSIPTTIIMYAVIGIIASLLLGAFIKKDKPQDI